MYLGGLVLPGMAVGLMRGSSSSIESDKVFVQFMVFTPIRQRYGAKCALNREIKIIFDKRGIKMPTEEIIVHDAKQ